MVLILHASDLHFGREDTAALNWFRAQADLLRPDAVVITGDITMRARAAEFEAAARWLDTLPAPVSLEIGNHDLPYFNIVERIGWPYARFRQLEARIERPLALADIALVPLRTTARVQRRLNWSKGYLTRRRIAEAVAALGAAPQRHRLVATHHPLIEAGTSGTAHTRRGADALEQLAAAGATAILSGHVHDPFDRSVAVAGQTIRLIGAGTLSERVRESQPGFNILQFDGPHMTVRHVVMDDQKLNVRSA